MLRRLPWPLPALLAWTSAWLVFLLAAGLGLHPAGAAMLGGLTGLVWAMGVQARWRQFFLVLGFPASLALGAGMAGVAPGWVWLLGLLLLLLLYPMRAWRDAPLFPTPAGALDELSEVASLQPHATILDAGCGTGAGLRALHQVYPLAQLHGIEQSWPLRLWCGWRCPWAQVRQGDIWRADWSGYAMVYLFQRPESMAQAAAKAAREMKPGTWLVSLEFEVTDWAAHAVLDTAQGRKVWIYRLATA